MCHGGGVLIPHELKQTVVSVTVGGDTRTLAMLFLLPENKLE